MTQSNFMPEGIEQRLPVTDIHPDVQMLDREWRLITEAVRRDALVNSKVQEALIGFTDQPIAQTTASEMLTALQDDRRVTRLSRRMGGRLLSFLQIPEVPESAIVPDIANAPVLQTVEADAVDYESLGEEVAAQEIQDNAAAGLYTNALTDVERTVVARKYAYGRDVKLLALGAELMQQGALQLSHDNEVTLPSGIHIEVSPEFADQASVLLDPNKWKSRKQLKDRVYEIEVEGGRYIMKERKTARHVDTLKHNHIDGLTSAQEFEAGKRLHDTQSRREDRVKLSWEEPLGYAEYPDGFQFGIFAFEEGLGNSSFQTRIAELEEKIRDKRDEFETEYVHIAEAVHAYEDHPLVSSPVERQKAKHVWYQGVRRKKQVEETLSFEEFVRVKAHRLVARARELYKEATLDAGFDNTDGDYAFRLQDDPVGIEMIVYDYEYFKPITPQRVIEKRRDAEEYITSEPGSIFPKMMDNTRMERAAYLALMNAEGRLPKSVSKFKV